MLLKWIRKFLKFVRGGARPWQVAVSCLIGVAIGMAPSFTLTVVGLVVLFVLLNVNLGLCLLGLLVGKALCLALAPVTYPLGHWVIHDTPLTGLFRAAAGAPVLAWMGLTRYCLIGGIPIVLLVGGGGGLVLGWLIVLARRAVIIGGARSERVTRLGGNPAIKLLMRLLFGKQKTALADMLTAKSPVFRTGGVIACGVLLVLLAGGQWLLADRITAAGLKRGLEAATGAEVNVGEVGFSLLSGHLTIHDLRMTDPDDPEYDMARIDRLTGDLSIGSLLARRFVLDEIVIGRLESHVKRDTKGKVFGEFDEDEAPVTDQTISTYFPDGDLILDYLGKARRYLQQRDWSRRQRRQAEPPSPAEIRRQAMLKGYLGLSARDLVTPAPTVTVRRLVIEAIDAGDVGPLQVEALQLSSHPELTGEPMVLKIVAPNNRRAQVTLNFADDDASPHALDLNAPDLPVGWNGKIQVDGDDPARSARVSVAAHGTFTHEAVDLSVDLAVRKQSVTLGVEGPLAAPRVRYDRQQLATLFKDVAVDYVLDQLDAPDGDGDDDRIRQGVETFQGLLP